MGNVRLYGSTSGYTELAPPAVAPDGVLALPSGAGTIATEAFVTDDYLPIAGGKILQIVRATDTTSRSTSSATFVDVTGMTVTITPQKNTSRILVIATGCTNGGRSGAGDTTINYQITNSANTALSGAEKTSFGDYAGNVLHIASFTIIGSDLPGVTTAVTYKLRFASETTAITTTLRNHTQAGQMYAIEVSA